MYNIQQKYKWISRTSEMYLLKITKGTLRDILLLMRRNIGSQVFARSPRRNDHVCGDMLYIKSILHDKGPY